MCNTFKISSTEMSLPVHWLPAVTTDNTNSGGHHLIIALCRKDESFPKLAFYHCIIFQEALCVKLLPIGHAMNVIVTAMNCVSVTSLRHPSGRCQRQTIRYYLAQGSMMDEEG
jgi:hypothetical protein